MINLVGGGPINEKWFETLDKSGQWVGVDRGAHYLLQKNIQFNHAFGDFDSVSPEEFMMIREKVEHIHDEPPEKDMTDMEIALNWALKQDQPVRVIGVTGGRLDHFFGNIQLLLSQQALEHPYTIVIEDEKNLISCHFPGRFRAEKNELYPYLSFIPFTTNVKGLTLSGVKYPLSRRHITYGMTLTLSNEIVDDFASISFEDGILMMIRSRD
ncbi:thiamine diphosphokinase [Jeotgalibacillus haloalkalitolerans]|uniref:Thiamine diphosphokinase n=1 Tax=Jeotgalibacillus haloalkalitolerans TaxID=3104292 RepID=A0ABU5KKI8_9BACL|nr:thiamine diphosphokinase [Jeotgalibacillus sp. HH7-29]MDZ5711677.1 thiamine diphosphokinase [Jeotgalibacillus sp. HH7-29]